MALYLGNQKVSLRSGQDPTFDYGFDSNGRLVFANKNAKEINNFLNYDSSYSEILDLSNLSKMEKVAVNGTAGRKMEGLKGLLVSPNAPFTGTSPQINVSYTGLNKSALVSLFESVPYNVGYTKVGNPTIVDGVASGLSDSNYLQLSSIFPDITNYNVEILITLYNAGDGSSQGYRSVLLISPFSLAITNTGSPTFVFESRKIGETTYTKRILYNWAFVTHPGKCVLKFTKQGNILRFQGSHDGQNFTTGGGTYTLEDGEVLNQDEILPIFMCSNMWTNIGTTLDLNETYIKVNNIPYFTGKPAMTKTCSIVGATGTADLTQEDKNIILNKGWSLTVQ